MVALTALSMASAVPTLPMTAPPSKPNAGCGKPAGFPPHHQAAAALPMTASASKPIAACGKPAGRQLTADSIYNNLSTRNAQLLPSEEPDATATGTPTTFVTVVVDARTTSVAEREVEATAVQSGDKPPKPSKSGDGRHPALDECPDSCKCFVM